MLTIIVPMKESFDDATQEFVVVESFTLELEHSLVSLSKWESRFEVPFLSGEEKTSEQSNFYVQCMTLTPNVPPEVFQNLSADNYDAVTAYIEAKMTATWFAETKKSGQAKEIITAEILYYWMVSMTIDWQAQYWHLNRLITLVRVISEKNAPAKKLSRRELAQRNASLNAQRKAQFNTKG